MMPTEPAKAGAVGIFVSTAPPRSGRSPASLASLYGTGWLRHLEVQVGTPMHEDAAWSSSVTSLVSDDLDAFLQALPAHHVLLKITYPTAAQIAREQQEHVARLLFTQGLKRSALLVESGALCLVFSEPREAWDTYCCLRFASLALEVRIYRVGAYREALAERHARGKASSYPALYQQTASTVDGTKSPT